MKLETITKLKRFIVAKHFVNCHSRGFTADNRKDINCLLSNLMEGYENVFVPIDIREFQQCQNDEDEARALLSFINRELTDKGLETFNEPVISISSALLKWGNELKKRALLVFHCFHDIYSEKEKRILRSLRKTFRNREDISSYLGILIVSNKKVVKWELMPESNLDERHVFFFEIKNVKTQEKEKTDSDIGTTPDIG